MNAPLTLISHALCPYVQRVAIVLAEKALPFERRDIDLANKPDWFLEISPLGKTPVLLVGGHPIFESAVICEYLEETSLPRLHPTDALQRARHRSWVEFGSAMLNQIAAFYNAKEDIDLSARVQEICARLGQIEDALVEGPYFAGESFSMVDAAFAPVFRYFDVFDAVEDFGFWADHAKVRRWRMALAARPSVAAAVTRDYPQLLRRFLVARHTALSRRLTPAVRRADHIGVAPALGVRTNRFGMSEAA